LWETATGASAGRECKERNFPSFRACEGASRNDERWNDEGAKMRPFCCEYPRKLMQFFPKNDPPPQTDSEHGAA
jgi:hypothetical protein